MKNIKKIIFLALIGTFKSNQFLTAITLEKLNLKELEIKNTTEQEQTIVVHFYQKCSSCPRFHGTSQKSFTISPEQTSTIKDVQKIIKIVQLSDKTNFLNFISKKEPDNGLFKISTTHNETFPLHVDFESTLKNNDDYSMLKSGHKTHLRSLPKDVSCQEFFDKIKTLYNTNITAKKQSTPKIPQLIHVVWFGRTDIPDLFKQWYNQWQTKHPGWTCMLWNENKVKENFPEGLVNQTIYDEAHMMHDHVTKSKVVRYEILRKFGGLYVDPDLKCFESFQPLHAMYDFYCGLGHFNSWGAINNGVIGSRKDHPILTACIEYIKSCETGEGGFYDWTAKNLGHQLFTSCVYQHVGKAGNIDIIFPPTFFDGNDVIMEFNHVYPPHQAAYEHIKHEPEAFCARGVYDYSKDKK